MGSNVSIERLLYVVAGLGQTISVFIFVSVIVTVIVIVCVCVCMCLRLYVYVSPPSVCLPLSAFPAREVGNIFLNVNFIYLFIINYLFCYISLKKSYNLLEL